MGFVEDEINSYRDPQQVAAEKKDRDEHSILSALARNGIHTLSQYESMREMALMRTVKARTDAKRAAELDKQRDDRSRRRAEADAMAVDETKADDKEYD